MHSWNGGINLGFSVARGNRQSENLALAFNGVHPTLHDKITPYASSIDTKNDLASPSTVKLGTSAVVTENAGLFPDLQLTGEYRFTSNIGTVTKVNKWLGWQNQFSDIYVSNPPTSAKNNDLIFTTGLNISFTHYLACGDGANHLPRLEKVWKSPPRCPATGLFRPEIHLSMGLRHDRFAVRDDCSQN